jgi:hypothetical protein
MALQLRRGLEADRGGITPAEGELIYVTDTGKVYVGDGSTAGGVDFTLTSTISNVVDDVTPQLGGNLDLNNKDIVGTGNINISGTITATGSINLGDGAGSDIINIGGEVSGGLVPTTDGAFSLGTNSQRWSAVYTGSISATGQIDAPAVNANIIGDDSAVAYNKTNNTFSGTFVGELTGDVKGSVFADDSTAMVDAVAGTFSGNLTGNTTGYHTGDVSGSIFAQDSSVMVDAINGHLLALQMFTNKVRNTGGDLLLEDTTGAGQIRIGNDINLRPAGGGLINIASTDIDLETAGGGSIRLGADIDLVPESGDVKSTNIVIDKDDDIARIGLVRNSTDSSAIAESTAIARITYSTKLGTDESKVQLTNEIREEAWILVPSPEGYGDPSKTLRFHNEGKLGINGLVTSEPDANLHVTGNVKISGGELLLGNMDETTRDALTAANGMMIYNTTANKFQGYENGSWVNLV